MKGEKSQSGLPTSAAPAELPEPSPPPARAAAYIPPTEVPRESRYHTLDLKAVRLAPEIDPARMKTQMSLRRVSTSARPGRSPSVVVALTLAGVALGLGAWWSLQWWREQPRVVQSLPVNEPQVTAAIVLAVPAAVQSSASAVAALNEQRANDSPTQLLSKTASAKTSVPRGVPGAANPRAAKKVRKGTNTEVLPVPGVAVQEPAAPEARPRVNSLAPATAASQPELWLK